MTTLIYLANSGAFFAGGAALGYFLRDIRNALKDREVKVIVISKDGISVEETENGEDHDAN